MILEINLYSTGCPKCEVLENKLNEKSLEYKVLSDKDEMIKLGFDSVPMLVVDGKIMNFPEAIKWVNNL